MPEFIHSTRHIQNVRNHDIEERMRIESDRQDARIAKRLRDLIGHRLISIGERLVEKPTSEQGALAEAA